MPYVYPRWRIIWPGVLAIPTVDDPPNRFRRFMQWLIFGIYWQPAKPADGPWGEGCK
jgi:hypothetical protein